MGGGIGLSVHGDIRVTSEAGLFAMPETAIAMFPDVGASFMLPRLPGALGMYLGLTGARLHGADAVHAGIATHFVTHSAMHGLNDAIARDGVSAVATHAQPLPPFSLAPHRAAIDLCFGQDSIADITRALEAEGSDWARESLQALAAMSPSSLLWSFEIIRRGEKLDLRTALAEELRLTRSVSVHPDFAEGVRAMLVDKDRQPRWAAADPAAITAMFSSGHAGSADK